MNAWQLREALKRSAASTPEMTLDIRGGDGQTRSWDTALLVAAVGSAGAALGSLITGILKIVEKGKGGIVKVQGRSGRSIEISTDVSPEQLEKYVRIAHELDVERIELP